MKESNSHRVAKNSGYLFIRMILVLLVTLYTSRVVLKTLGFEDFGIYNVVGSVVVFLSFLQSALNTATYRYIAYELGTGNRERLKEVYSMAINCHVLLALVLLVVMEIGGVWFINTRLVIPPDRLAAANWAYQFSLFTFCLHIIRTPFNSNIIAHEHMNFFALVSIVEVLLSLGVAFFITHSPTDKLITYASLLSLVALVMFLCYAIYCARTFKDTVYVRCWKPQLTKKFASYAGWGLLVNAADVSTGQCISIFFNVFLGVVANAALGVTNQVIGAFNHFLNSFSHAFNPQIIKNYAAGRYDAFMRMVMATSKVSFYFVFGLSLPIVLNIDYVLGLWLGDYPPLAPAFIQTVIFYALIDALQAPLVNAVHATGRIKRHQQMMSTIKFAAIPVMYLMLWLGMPGVVALAVRVVANALCAVVRTLYMKRLIGLNLRRYLIDVVVRLLVVAGVVVLSCVAICALVPQGGFRLVLTSGVVLVLSIVLSLVIGFNKSERQLFRTMPIIRNFYH